MAYPEATQHIRRLPLKQQPVIVALTANAVHGARDEYLAQGMDDYLSKPVDLQQLIATLRKYARTVRETALLPLMMR